MSDVNSVKAPSAWASFKIWMEIISNPFKGYALVDAKTKIALPVLLIMILSLASTLMLRPITTSSVYQKAMLEIQYSAIEKRQGSPLSDEMKATYATQLSSPTTKMITDISTYVGAIGGYLLILFISALVLKIISAVMKIKITYGHFFRILAFAAIVTIIQTLVKSTISLTGNWQSMLKTVQTAGELGNVISAPISLAALTTQAQIGKIGYFFLNTFTDIFTWLYYIVLYAGLRASAKMTKKSALIMSIVNAFLGIIIGYLAIAFV